MTDKGILEDVATTLGAVAGVDPSQITADQSIRDGLGIDSITMVEAVVALEDRFGLLIPDDEWSQFTTIGDIVAFLDRSGVGVQS
jgi:acyl carrier protein